MISDTDRRYSLYVHTSPSGKRYVGITCQNPKKRWCGGCNYVGSVCFYNAIKKYGWDNFTHQILVDGLAKGSAEFLERQFIERWQTTNNKFGYNLKSGGGVNGKHSLESRKKMSISSVGKPAWNKGKTTSLETRMKLSKASKGRIMSDETRLKLHNANIGKCLSEEHKRKIGVSNGKPVIMIDSETGEELMRFNSLSDAGRFVGGTNQNISAVILGKRKHAYGYMWKSADKGGDASDKRPRP